MATNYTHHTAVLTKQYLGMYDGEDSKPDKELVSSDKRQDSEREESIGSAKNDSPHQQNEENSRKEEEMKAEVEGEEKGGNEDDDGIPVVQPKAVAKRRAPELPHIDRRNWLIHQHFIRNEKDTCRALIEETLIDTVERNEFALYIKGMLLVDDEKYQAALEVFQKCTTLNPNETQYIKQIARCLFLMEKRKRAIELFTEMLNLQPEDGEAHYYIGLCHYQNQDLEKAKESLKTALKTYLRDDAFVLLAELLTQDGDLIGAIDVAKAGCEFAPENVDLLSKLGVLYIKVGSPQPAFEAIGRALSFDPEHVGAIMAAGAMMQQHGDYDVALNKYRVAAAHRPESAQVWSNIGACFHGKGKHIAAVTCLKRAHSLAPLEWRIAGNLGMAYLKMQQYASAFQFLNAAVNMQPDEPSLYGLLAIALTHLEDYENASQAYRIGLEMDRTDPVVALNCAVFHHRQGDRSSAMQFLQAYEQRLGALKEERSAVVRSNNAIMDTADRLRKALNLTAVRNVDDASTWSLGHGRNTSSDGENHDEEKELQENENDERDEQNEDE